jgi:hypothetical protein
LGEGLPAYRQAGGEVDFRKRRKVSYNKKCRLIKINFGYYITFEKII